LTFRPRFPIRTTLRGPPARLSRAPHSRRLESTHHLTETETPSETEHAETAALPEAGTAPEMAAPEMPAPEQSAEPAPEPAPEPANEIANIAAAPEAPAEAEPAPVETAAADEASEPVSTESDYPEVEEPIDEAPAGFEALGLSEPILRAVAEMGYSNPTPIQQQAIPFVLMGRDVLGCAQTGTGKTASFTLPMMDILQSGRARARMPRSLILEPTRELALQVAENFVKYGKYLKLTHALIIGGESMSDQKDLLTRGVDVLIATPGRLIDMFERGGMLLTQTSVLVIDEADRMLDMGFIPDVEKIVSLLPPNRQTLFFSATMAPEIRRLADAFLRNPKEITVAKPASVATTITSHLAVVGEHDKREALRRLIRSEDVQNALIFCNRKRDVDVLYKSLTKHGFSVGALHGDLAQSQRFATLEKFKAGEIRLLCCSDVAARGIDIGGLSHVFNFDVPIHSEDYVHRIGRTGRAGREGRTFMLATPEDRLAVEAIEKLTGAAIERIQIPGLDPVDWSEGRGRRGRGRPVKGGDKRPGRPERAAKSDAGLDEKRDERRPRPERPERGPRPERAERPRAAGGAEPMPIDAPQPDIPSQPFGERTERHERRPERGDRPRFEGRDRPERFDRDARRERYRRDDDLGPPVLGFGDDVPAFMLISARKRPAEPDARAGRHDRPAPTPRHAEAATETAAADVAVVEPAESRD
jgi:superfamily II DNA/RNA helicase